MNFCPAKVAAVNCGPFSDGFHAGDSLATLDMADLALFHTTRTDTMSVPPTELMGSLTHEAHEPVMASSSKTSHNISVA